MSDFIWNSDVSIAMLVGKDLSMIDANINPDFIPPLPNTKNVLRPDNGIRSITFSNDGIGAKEEDGTLIWEKPNWKDTLFDKIKSGPMAEFKWYRNNDNIGVEIMLPTDFNISLDKTRTIENVTIYGRAAGNGVIKTSKLVAYNDTEKVHESDIVEGTTPMFAIHQQVTKLVWTPLTSSGSAPGIVTITAIVNESISATYELEVLENSKEKLQNTYTTLNQIYEVIKETDNNKAVVEAIEKIMIETAHTLEVSSPAKEDVQKAFLKLVKVESYLEVIENIEAIEKLLDKDLQRYDNNSRYTGRRRV